MSPRRFVIGAVVVVAAAVVLVLGVLLRTGPPGARTALPALPAEARSAASLETSDALPSALLGVPTAPVQGGWTGPGGGPFHVALRTGEGTSYRFRSIGRETFDVGMRLGAPARTHEPCTSCHVRERLTPSAARDPGVHDDIQPVHPQQTGATCSSCHVPTNVGLVQGRAGEPVELDHAYRLCAQCHFQQVDSWANGAHGKRLAAWRGTRVLMGCADCHDPHRPAVQPRMPMAGVQLPGARLDSGTEGDGHE